MSMLNAFIDMMQVTAQHQKPVTTLNAARQPIKTWENNGSTFKCGKWTNTSTEVLLNNSFENSEIGTILVDPEIVSLTFNQGDRLLINSEYYYILGPDDTIAMLGEVILLQYRKEYGKRS